jgi:hypothetical protein
MPQLPRLQDHGPDQAEGPLGVKHEGAMQDGKTCIDCHKGIAHKPVHHLKKDPAQAQAALRAAGTKPGGSPAPAKRLRRPGRCRPCTSPTTVAAVPEQPAKATTSAMKRRPLPRRPPLSRRGTVAQPAKATAKAEATAPAPAAGTVAALDWSKVPTRQIKVFYPGQAGLEWVMNKADHSSAARHRRKEARLRQMPRG